MPNPSDNTETKNPTADRMPKVCLELIPIEVQAVD